MSKLYEKSRLAFALVSIGLYVVLASVADALSELLGTEKAVTAPLLIALSIVFGIWVLRSGKKETFGLVLQKGAYSPYLYYLPLLLLTTANLWNGVRMNLPPLESALYILSMLAVGFLEELIFRGFLFTALLENGRRSAYLVSSVTFGVGHIVNLLNGAELVPTLLQIVSAVLIGFLFTAIFDRSKSLVFPILAHGIFNSLAVFSASPENISPLAHEKLLPFFGICVLAAAYSAYLLCRRKEEGKLL